MASAYLATIAAIGDQDMSKSGISGWHALITVAVAAAFVLAPALRMPLLYAVGAFGAFMWLTLVIPIATQSVGWALLVVGLGVTLVALAGVGARVASRRSDSMQP